MNSNNLSIDLTKVLPKASITVRVKGMRRLRARWWIAVQLFELAALISGTDCEVDVKF